MQIYQIQQCYELESVRVTFQQTCKKKLVIATVYPTLFGLGSQFRNFGQWGLDVTQDLRFSLIN